MGKINWARVFLGGVVAGIIIDVFEFVLHGIVLNADWRQTYEALGRPMQESTAGMMIYILLGLAIGILAVWFYAAIRPRYTPGPKTAVCAGLGVWLLGYLVPTIGLVPGGLFPGRLLAIAVIVGLVEILVATQVGAWLYKEGT